VGEIAHEFDQRLAALNKRVGDFLDGGWTDRPGTAFADVFTEWSTGTGECRDGLAEMARALADNADAYAQRDQAIADSMPASPGIFRLGAGLDGTGQLP
jgi:WXG100 family type VII secretion target